MRLNREEYRQKVLGCWLGKNIGGTLGAPFEWRRQVNDVGFYTQDLAGEPLPNDDLDIQLLWLVALEERGIALTAHTLAEYWCLYVTPHWCEYGTAKINMRQGLLPPLTGTLHNAYRLSCGAFIRSEIWACICPGRPDLAARYCYEDAILDHGSGEGTYAEVFVGAVEAAAFVVPDMRKLLEIGLSYIPADCGVTRAVHTAVECFDSGRTWLEARDEVLRLHRGGAFWNMLSLISPEDQAKGFHEGVVGYDVPSNIGMTVLGLLYGGGDFDKMICTTVNCGEDTDCTGATAGSIFGIIHGAGGIPERWIQPIGRKIKVACLNLGELGYFGNQLPQDVDTMTDRTERVARQVMLRHGGLDIEGAGPTDLGPLAPDRLKAPDHGASLFGCLRGSRHDFDFFTVCVDYGDSPGLRDGEPAPVRLTVHNNYKVQTNLTLHWYVPDGWTVSPSPDAFAMSMPSSLGSPLDLEFEVVCPTATRSLHRAAVEITAEGRPTVMLVPLVFLNGNVAPVR
jgi:ADP-ribosylglycohydrolase